MSTFLQQLRAFHDQLDPQRRRVLYIALTMAIATILAVGVWANQESWVTITPPATADGPTEARQALAAAEIPHRIDPVTGIIQVPASSRIVAEKAINSGDAAAPATSSIIDSPDKVRQQLIFNRQAELQRTINGYDGVLSSSVLLNLPERSPFFKDDHVATASVVLRADPGVILSPKLGRTIARAVSGANESMSLYDVSVSDATGRELWPGDMDNEGGGSAALQSARRESEMARSLLGSLAIILGSTDDVTVSVSVDVDTSTREQKVSQLDPNSGVTREEVVKSIKNGGRPAEGVPGTDTNLPDAASTTTSGAGGRSEDATTTKFDYSQTTTITSTPAGGIKRLNASVNINAAAIARLLGTPEGQEPDEKAAAKLMADLEEATRAALGYDAARGDQVVVKFIRFAPITVEPVAEPALIAQAEPYLPAAVALVAALAVVFGVIRPLLKMVRPATAGGATGAVGPNGEPAMVVGPDGTMVPAANGPMPDEPAGETSVDLMERLRQYIDNYQAVTPADLSDLVRRETVHSAEVVRRWIRG